MFISNLSRLVALQLPSCFEKGMLPWSQWSRLQTWLKLHFGKLISSLSHAALAPSSFWLDIPIDVQTLGRMGVFWCKMCQWGTSYGLSLFLVSYSFALSSSSVCLLHHPIFIFLFACCLEKMTLLNLLSLSPSSYLSIRLSRFSDPHLGVAGFCLRLSLVGECLSRVTVRGQRGQRVMDGHSSGPLPFPSPTSLLSLLSRGSALLVMAWNMIWV